MPIAVVSDPVPAGAIAGVRAVMPADVTLVAPDGPSLDAFARAAANADILLSAYRPVNAALLAAAPRLRLVQRFGVGYDNLDLDAIQAAGLLCGYTPGANATAVAEHTILLTLALLKHLVFAEQASRTGHWAVAEMLTAGLGDLDGATVGLAGLGHIGQAVAKRLTPFGARVLYTVRHRHTNAEERRLGVEFAALPELLAQSTIVSLHLPLNPTTANLIGARELSLMQRGALLVNTSRGGLVDEAALHAAVASGHLGGAGLDVLVSEADGGNPFTDLPNVIVTPHSAALTRQGLGRIFAMAAENVAAYVAGRPIPYPVPGFEQTPAAPAELG